MEPKGPNPGFEARENLSLHKASTLSLSMLGMFSVNKNPSSADLRKFGDAMFLGFFLIGALLFFSPWLRTRDVLDLGWTGSGIQDPSAPSPAPVPR